jgi:hypothetical protein
VWEAARDLTVLVVPPAGDQAAEPGAPPAA